MPIWVTDSSVSTDEHMGTAAVCVWEGPGVQMSNDTEPDLVLSIPDSTSRKEQDSSCETQGLEGVGSPGLGEDSLGWGPSVHPLSLGIFPPGTSDQEP